MAAAAAAVRLLAAARDRDLAQAVISALGEQGDQ